MFYIEYDSEGNITRMHGKPFDDKRGLGKTEEQLLETGLLFEKNEIPNEDGVLKINLETMELFKEPLEELPNRLDPEEAARRIEKLEEDLENSVIELSTALSMLMMGGNADV
ncbi:hypothetical protein FLK61_35100 [Paenalkalicoccus suaedae]|uniref:Uncharacterized protein n=1 Tax=Paenalkalicoccus suaedae TaxID=2592382 RepID=A0A859FFL3_9BACI|nr:hypothetical protein [Paenalkalicoccus suaedae]QKS71897.1 hypothetical protein FLK61_35100 [Paenalkalicoccus suaedae]